MRVIIALPARLRESVSSRLATLPASAAQILLHEVESGAELPQLQSGDGLLVLQPDNIEMARRTGESAAAAQIHYAEIALLETTLGNKYGFMLAVAGKPQDLHTLSPIINALAPAPYAWWHVGSAGSAAFLAAMLQYVGAAACNPIDLSNPMPRLAQFAVWQNQAGIQAAEFLAMTEGEHFTPALPDRQRALASFLDGAESPARQIARMICLFAKLQPIAPQTAS